VEESDARHPIRRLRRLLAEPWPVPVDVTGGPNSPEAPPSTPVDLGGLDPAGITENQGDERPGAGGDQETVHRKHGADPMRRRPLVAGLATVAVAVVGAAAYILATSGAPTARAPLAPTHSRTVSPAASPVLVPTARVDASLAYDPATRTMLLYGGISDLGGDPEESVDTDTWSWNGERWRELQPSTSPPPLIGAALGYDPASGTLVLTGGSTTNWDGLGPSDSTWIWNGSTWISAGSAGLPADDYVAAIATDAASGQLILVTTATGCLGFDTWLWKADTASPSAGRWVMLLPAASPPPAQSYGVAYDPATAALDLFRAPGYCGGATTTAASPVWSWDGENWSPEPSAVGGYFAGSWEMTTSATGEVLVTVEGTYLWAGGDRGSWSEVSTSPSSVGAAAMAYDAAARQVVVFGGSCAACGEAPTADTWTWNGSGGWVHRTT